MKAKADIRERAVQILDDVGVRKPPVNVHDIARHLGVMVVNAPAMEGFSGFLHQKAGEAPVIGVSSGESPRRRNFTIAHEIGHFVLHAHDPLHVDESDKVSLLLRSEASSQGTDRVEIEANQFAAELLMPQHFLKKDVEAYASLGQIGDAEIKKLATRYGVSVQAMSIRLCDVIARK